MTYLVNGESYTIDEYEAMFNEYYDSVVNAQDIYDKALEAYNNAKGKEGTLKTAYDNALEGVTTA